MIKNKNMRKLLVKDTLQCLLLSVILFFILSLIVINASFFNPFVKVVKDFSFLDVYYAENFNDDKTINTDIVVINVEDRDRFEISLLLESVIKAKPKVVGVDLIFKELKEPYSDSLLASHLKHEKVIQAFVLDEDTNIYNHSNFRTNNEGFVNFNFDNQESVIREFVGIHNKGNKQYLAWSALVAKMAIGDSIWEQRKYSKHLKGNTPIKYFGRNDSFMIFSYDEYMAQANKAMIKDKIVVLGYVGSPTGNIYNVEDKHFTPLNAVTSGKSIPDMFGAVVNANIISMLINDSFLYRISNFWIIVMTLFFNFFLVMYYIKLDKKDKLGARTGRKIAVVCFSVFLVGISFLIFKVGVILEVAPIIAFSVFTASVVKYYKHFINRINKKIPWKSYLLD